MPYEGMELPSDPVLKLHQANGRAKNLMQAVAIRYRV
jgi:hypothetical protein